MSIDRDQPSDAPPDLQEHDSTEHRDTRVCPYRSEVVLASARKGKRCNEFLDDALRKWIAAPSSGVAKESRHLIISVDDFTTPLQNSPDSAVCEAAGYPSDCLETEPDAGRTYPP